MSGIISDTVFLRFVKACMQADSMTVLITESWDLNRSWLYLLEPVPECHYEIIFQMVPIKCRRRTQAP